MSAEATQNPSGVDWKRIIFMFVGVGLFLLVHFSPPWPGAFDPNQPDTPVLLMPHAKTALAIFLWAGTWWVFEVVPIGVTSLLIGVLQTLFMVRDDVKAAFKDFMDPSVLFIFGSIIIGTVFTKTGLTRRLAYKMLMVVGERTSMIYLGCFVVTAALTHFMAHTAVAATVFPLLLVIYNLYDEEGTGRPTKFGKGLFIGMAYVAGAGSIITLLGAARGMVALGFFEELEGKSVTFFKFMYYNFPIGWIMVFVLWGFFMIFFKPEKKRIEGLREKVTELSSTLGSITRQEIIALVIVLGVIVFMSLQSFIPALKVFNKAAVLLCSTILFFVLKILDIEDLEAVPWNIILLFAGAMSIGFCLWETGAARWLALQWLTMFQNANWFVFVMSIAFFVMVMTNFIMNVAAIAISLPVALVIAPYLNVAGEVVLFASLCTAGMPFLLLVGAAPNAIAYESKQFTSGEFFIWGLLASVLLMGLVALAIGVIWPIMGMPITL